MRYALFALAGVYGLLSIVAALVQMKTAQKKDTSILMLLGGLLLLAAVASGWTGWDWDYLAAVSGGILIIVAAWINGKRGGHIHYIHHAVRFAFTVLLVAGFAFL